MQVIAFLYLEASQSNDSKCFRLELGCMVHPKLASMIILLARLF
jgi:hypothetical protein